MIQCNEIRIAEKKRFVDAAVFHNLLHNDFTFRVLLLFENT